GESGIENSIIRSGDSLFFPRFARAGDRRFRPGFGIRSRFSQKDIQPVWRGLRVDRGERIQETLRASPKREIAETFEQRRRDGRQPYFAEEIVGQFPATPESARIRMKRLGRRLDSVFSRFDLRRRRASRAEQFGELFARNAAQLEDQKRVAVDLFA